ncbi:cytochrome d ubiquinol oxidase subunit II [Plantactinospora sp. S1510]|uniref:Cytochrome d ubiquinol oxidase subunit II n=1 Tax=Plantactinospora alkalitolerans TaxID=2789879 RepID=A0ABS0GTQ6_9ACTN|nr:cytochrome d ubiquinol oxidase subunit II [Plantactinospora alkalitolerans]MBF9129573.1 cytochrome d ubiquinol oxidase subunit II [Plantactinospora alkalitolerans]
MDLPTVWFLLIAALFTGYFILEGFDFGVGILLPVLGRNDRERRVLINTIGPVWDGNEVWLITAAGGLFAAFPGWYATLFSGFYLPLLLILLALIFRGVAFEYRHKRTDTAWKNRWDVAIFLGSLLPAVLWGIVVANLLRGVPLAADHEYAGGLLDLLSPYALLGGATTAALFTTHGAVFLALKTTGQVRDRAGRLAARGALATTLLAGTFLAITLTIRHTPAAVGLAAGAAVALLGALTATRVRREGWAFVGTAAAIGLTVATLFAALFPNVLPSTTDPAGTLTVANAASGAYSLKVMTWVAVVFAPLVLAYQGWTYWVFRKRIGVANIPE